MRQDCSSLRCICCIVCHAQVDFSETGLLITEVYMLYCLSCPGGLQRDRIALHCGVYVVLSVMPRWTSARQDCSSLRCICCIVCHAHVDFSETGLLFTAVYMLYCLLCPGGLQRDRIALHCGVYVVLSVMPMWTSARQDCSSLRCICCIVCHAQVDFSETGLLFTAVYMLYCLSCPGGLQRDRIARH